VAEEPVRPAYLDAGGVEQDPGQLLASVLASGRRAIQAAGRTADVIALANQGETVMAWDPITGTPLSPAIGWQDRRAEKLCAELAGDKQWVAQRTGLVLDPYFSAPKMAWLRRTLTAEGVAPTQEAVATPHPPGRGRLHHYRYVAVLPPHRRVRPRPPARQPFPAHRTG